MFCLVSRFFGILLGLLNLDKGLVCPYAIIHYIRFSDYMRVHVLEFGVDRFRDSVESRRRWLFVGFE